MKPSILSTAAASFSAFNALFYLVAEYNKKQEPFESVIYTMLLRMIGVAALQIEARNAGPSDLTWLAARNVTAAIDWELQ